jgi:hypothetical protein
VTVSRHRPHSPASGEGDEVAVGEQAWLVLADLSQPVLEPGRAGVLGLGQPRGCVLVGRSAASAKSVFSSSAMAPRRPFTVLTPRGR